MKGFLTLDDADVKDKTILLRVDINVPYDEGSGKIQDSERMREHAKTVWLLSERGAKVVVLAHQGRKGDPDFIHLGQHARLLSKHVGKKVDYVEDIAGERAKKKIKAMKSGEILLLDNVRMLDDESEEKTPEQHAQSTIVRSLSNVADIFVNDAFSAAHRSHASIVGFTATLPSYAGSVMESEMNSSSKVVDSERPVAFVLGGGKPDDCLKIMKFMLDSGKLDFALTCGAVGELFLMAKGVDFGKATTEFFAKKGFDKMLPDAKKLLDKYCDNIMLPVDVAVSEDGSRKEMPMEKLPASSLVMDIGRKTAEKYRGVLEGMKTIVVKGPAGVYEQEGFETGTKMIMDAVAGAKSFSLICGGDTSVAIEKLGIDMERFSYVSIAGGALITALSGKPMPGIDALKGAAKRI